MAVHTVLYGMYDDLWKTAYEPRNFGTFRNILCIPMHVNGHKYPHETCTTLSMDDPYLCMVNALIFRHSAGQRDVGTSAVGMTCCDQY
jgi:hypothetical protein